MQSIRSKNIKSRVYKFFPVTLLFFSVLNEFDFNNLGLKYFSFNFSYILIFYYSLKKSENMGLGLVFVAGLFNDVVVGLPMGLSSLIYLLLCGSTAYLRNITLSPNLLKDWIFFLVTILCLNSLSFMILNFFFDFEIIYFNEIINVTFTFLLYFIFSNLFDFIERLIIGAPFVR
jgi:rod shape-determining protein MreD